MIFNLFLCFECYLPSRAFSGIRWTCAFGINQLRMASAVEERSRSALGFKS
jgi:hypothetical protein